MKTIAKIIDKNTICVCDPTQFDADAIMHSGQVFRYFGAGGEYKLVAGNNYAEISLNQMTNDKGQTTSNAVIKSNDSGYFYNYFDFGTDYDEIKNGLDKYEKLRPAIKAGGGIRILRAEFAETAISFIISANNNIKRFTKTLNLICENYGARLDNGLFAFPTLERLSAVSERDFQRLGCGYRSPYLVKAVRQLKSPGFDALNKLPNASLDKELQNICGVGPKVSGCIMLFCFHRLDVAPVDTWIKKALAQFSEDERKALLNEAYAGAAQQYMFYFLQFLRGKIF